MKKRLSNLYETYIHDFSKPFNQDLESFYFILILNGKLNISFIEEGESSELKINDFFSIKPDEMIKIGNPQNALAQVFKISWEIIVDIIPNYDQIQCHSRKYPSKFHVVLIKDFINLIEESNDVSQQNYSLSISYLYKFLHSLSLLIITNDSITEIKGQEGKYKSRVKNIKKFINANYMDPIRLIDLSNFLYLTPQYTSNFIKKYMNSSFKKLLTNVRIHKAAKKLLNSSNTITKIAYSCGFSNIQSFNSSFKLNFHITPHAYRTKYQNKLLKTDDSNTISKKKYIIAEQSLTNLNNDLNNDGLLYQKYFDIIVNANKDNKTFSKRIWQETINLGFAKSLLSSAFQSHIKDVQNELHFKYGRIQGIMNSDLIDKFPNSDRYNFSTFNRLIDFLYSVNIIPFIEFGDKPQKMNIRIDEYLFISDKKTIKFNNAEWSHFINSFLLNCINRYGQDELSNWKFELWLPHSRVLSYTDRQIEIYIEDYITLYNNAKKMLPDIQIGGFGFNCAADISVIKKVVSLVDAKNAKFDFFSFSSFHITDNNIPVLNSNLTYLEEMIKTIKKALHPYKIPLYLTEFTFDVTTRNYMHDSVFQGLYLLRNVVVNSDSLKTIAFWNLSDLSAEYKDINNILFGGNGIVSVDGLRKPVFYAYKFLSYLGSNIISQGNDHIITSKGHGSYQVLVFNYVHPSELSTYKYVTDFKPNDVNDIFINPTVKKYSINIPISTPGKYRIKSYVLNKNHGSVIDDWCRMGTDINLESSELEYIKNICIPKQDIEYLSVEDKLNIQGTIKPNEAKLFRIRIEM